MSDRTIDRPYAGCPSDGTPLIPTFERPKKEWHCMECGDWFAFFAARDAPATPDNRDLYESLLQRFKAGERGPIEAAVRAVDSQAPVGGVADDGTTTDGGTQ